VTFCDADYYYGEIPQVLFGQLLERARRDYWREALTAMFADNMPAFVDYMGSSTRAPWKHMLNLNGTTSKVLDIGAGGGAITFSLAEIFEDVYSLEYVRERIEFVSLRAEQDKVDNVHPVQASLFELPFAEGLFDAVICNGIIEWLGEWNPSGKPFDIQRDTIARLRGLLRPGGLLIIGIENRFGYTFLLGREDHNQLRYTSFMPRAVANIVSRWKLGKAYRTYTYSLYGYRKLLRQAGFGDYDVYCVSPGYNVVRAMTPVEASRLKATTTPSSVGNGLKRRMKEALRRALLRTNLWPFVSPDFIFFAKKY
jgi:2-polyprenyl-3-methyl-5-hydroxy-6-metoxy-1,4-benzoquinol methylase